MRSTRAPRDPRQRLLECFRRRIEGGQEGLALLHDMAPATGAGHVETVAAGVIEMIELHEMAHVVEIAARDDRHGGDLREPVDRAAHAVAQDGIIGIIDDGRERAVVIEEDGGAFAFEPGGDRVHRGERIRQAVQGARGQPPAIKGAVPRDRAPRYPRPPHRALRHCPRRATPITCANPPFAPAWTPEKSILDDGANHRARRRARRRPGA